jgi:predicted dehydrogenase
LIGFGYWGPNLLRNFSLSPHFEVVAVAEPRADRRQRAGEQYDGLRLHESAEDVVAAPDLDAVVVASPVATHYEFARQALEQGKHVLVEKPLARTVAEGEELAALAERQGLTLLVDHTFLFTGAVQTIQQLCKTGELGRISYYDSMRVNLGLFQPDVNVLWDLGPHDISIMDYILDEVPVHIEASGYCHVNPRVPDIAYLTLHFASDAVAHFNLSWMSPVKVRRTAIGGLKRMLVWDDLNREEKIKIYSWPLSSSTSIKSSRVRKSRSSVPTGRCACCAFSNVRRKSSTAACMPPKTARPGRVADGPQIALRPTAAARAMPVVRRPGGPLHRRECP